MNPLYIIHSAKAIKNGLFIYNAIMKNTGKMLKRMNEQSNMSFMNDLPEFSNRHIELNAEKAHAGYIIRRPLDAAVLSVFTYHYGIVLGTSVEGVEYILEMSKETNGIAITTKEDFLSGFSLATVEVVSRPVKITREEIIEKAKTVQYDVYDLFDFNCIDFVYFCVYDRKLPERSKVFLS